MKRIFLGKVKNSWRAVLFFALFGALLFSSGEGIRLFPFAAAAQDVESSFGGNEKSDYEKNFLRFEKSENGSFSKLQRGGKDFLTGAFIAPKSSLKYRSIDVLQTDFLPTPSIFNAQLIFQRKPSRAPPFS